MSHERGQVSEGVPSNVDLPVDTLHMTPNVQIPARHANSDILPYIPSRGIEYDQKGVDQDKLSTYTSLDDYDALFEARHGRGAIDNVTITGEYICYLPNYGSHFGCKYGCDREFHDWGKTKAHPWQWIPTS